MSAQKAQWEAGHAAGEAACRADLERMHDEAATIAARALAAEADARQLRDKVAAAEEAVTASDNRASVLDAALQQAEGASGLSVAGLSRDRRGAGRRH
jgi:hypothetical protein